MIMFKRVIRTCGVSAILLAVGITAASAAFIRVPTDEATLGDAVAAASANDIIILESGKHFQSTTITIGVTLAIIGEKKARLFAGNNDASDTVNRNVFDITADGVRIKNIEFRPRKGKEESRAVVVLFIGADNFTFAHNKVGKKKDGFTDAVFCIDSDNAQIYENEMYIVERRATEGGAIQGGNAAVTGLNDCNDLLVARNKIAGPGASPGRTTPAIVGIIDFNSVGGTVASNVQFVENEIEGFDTGIFVSSDNCIVEENDVDDSTTGIQMGQGASVFNTGTDPAVRCVVKQNKVRGADDDGINIDKGNDNLLLENNVKKDDIVLETDATDNLVRENKADDIIDSGTGNLLEGNDT